MATVATNFISRSAEEVNVSPLGFGGGAEVCFRKEACSQQHVVLYS